MLRKEYLKKIEAIEEKLNNERILEIVFMMALIVSVIALVVRPDAETALALAYSLYGSIIESTKVQELETEIRTLDKRYTEDCED